MDGNKLNISVNSERNDHSIDISINDESCEDLINAFQTIMLWLTYGVPTINSCFDKDCEIYIGEDGEVIGKDE